MQINKQYIEENLLNKKGWLNANYHKMVDSTREELYLIYNNKKQLFKFGGVNHSTVGKFRRPRALGV